MSKGTPLQPIIEALELAMDSVGSKDVILGLDFALTMVKGFEPVIIQQLESVKLEGANEAFREINEKF